MHSWKLREAFVVWPILAYSRAQSLSDMASPSLSPMDERIRLAVRRFMRDFS